MDDLSQHLDTLLEQLATQRATNAANNPIKYVSGDIVGKILYDSDCRKDNDGDKIATAIPKLKDADKIIAQEIKRLSLDEQNKVYEDIHGSTCIDEETPVFLAAKLDDMDIELNTLKPTQKPAFNLAMEQNKPYVENSKLRLTFLRADDYNPKLAAKRFVAWFDHKLDLFGKELLTEDITLKDLSDDSLMITEDGRCQVLPVRDSSGRAVFCCLKFDMSMLTTVAARRNFFYFTMVLMEDETNQRSGVVGIRRGHQGGDHLSPTQWKELYQCAKLTEILPMRLRGFHFIAEESSLIQQISSVLQVSFSTNVRHRCRTHWGTFLETKYRLMSYGIPVSFFPMTDEGEIKMTSHLRWLAQRRRTEALVLEERQKRKGLPVTLFLDGPSETSVVYSSEGSVTTEETGMDESLTASVTSAASSSTESCSPSSPVPEAVVANVAEQAGSPLTIQQEDQPSSSTKADDDVIYIAKTMDVLLGRGKPYQDHPGNTLMRQLVTDWFEKYEASPRKAKVGISEHIVQLIRQKGGRFVKRGSASYWVEIPDSEARLKVAHGFRKKREMLRVHRKQEISEAVDVSSSDQCCAKRVKRGQK